MPKEFHRSLRIGEQICRVLNELLRTELKDPRFQFVRVTDVAVSRDLSHAKVYFRMLNPDDDPVPVADALERAAGHLRGRLGRALTIHHVPALKFFHDDSLRRGAELTALIDEAVAEDTARAKPDRT